METEHRLDRLYREHAAQLIARLVRLSGRVDWAESAVQDAFVEATTAFEREMPDRPAGWLYRVARNRLTDRARREEVRLRLDAEQRDTELVDEGPRAALAGEWDDELMQMIIATCHPSLTSDEQVGLALTILCGLERASIAVLFRASDETIKKRLTTAKRKLRGVASLEAPGPALADDRLDAAMRVLYAVFTEGHKPRSGEHLLRADLCAEAIRLTEVLRRRMPGSRPTLEALLALMMLSAARLPARNSSEGGIVLLEHQDRSLWDRKLIDRGLVHLKNSATGEAKSPYHLEAAIAACHCLAPDFERTDWARIVGFYDELLAQRASAVFEVNRAVAVGFHAGFDRGLEELRTLPRSELVGYLPYHAAVGSLAERAGRPREAVDAYRVAANLSRSDADRAFFEGKIADMGSVRTSSEPGGRDARGRGISETSGS